MLWSDAVKDYLFRTLAGSHVRTSLCVLRPILALLMVNFLLAYLRRVIARLLKRSELVEMVVD